jgi:hypothetical protein
LAEIVVQRVLVGVQTIEVVHRKGRQVARAGAFDSEGLLGDGGLRRANVGVVVPRHGLDFGKRGQRLETVQIVDYGEILAEIGEEEHGEADACLVESQLRFLHVTHALLQRELCFDHIGVRGLSCRFLLLGDVHELSGLLEAALCVAKVALRDGHGIEVLHDDGGQTARRDFHPGARDRFRGNRHPVIGTLPGHEQIAVNGA